MYQKQEYVVLVNLITKIRNESLPVRRNTVNSLYFVCSQPLDSIIFLKCKTFTYRFLTNFASIDFIATMSCKPWYLDHRVLVVLSF